MHPAIIIGLVVLSYLSITSMPGASRDRDYEVPKIESRSGTETQENTGGPVETRSVQPPEPSVLSENKGNFNRGRNRGNDRFEKDLERAQKEQERQFKETEKQLAEIDKKLEKQLQKTLEDAEKSGR